MATLEVSEFTFGFTFLYEQVKANWGSLKSVPVLPSLLDEKNKGWDAHLPKYGTDVYFQFKISKYLSGNTAKYIRDGTYSTPYYRMDLHYKNGNSQHKLLRALSNASPETYYVGTEMHDESEFEAAFKAGDVVAKSRLIPLTSCSDLSDATRHSISFQAGNSSFIEHSAPNRREGSRFGGDLGTVLLGSRDRWQKIDTNFSHYVFEKLRASVIGGIDSFAPMRANGLSGLLNDGVKGWPGESLLSRASALALATVNASLVIVGESSE